MLYGTTCIQAAQYTLVVEAEKSDGVNTIHRHFHAYSHIYKGFLKGCIVMYCVRNISKNLLENYMEYYVNLIEFVEVACKIQMRLNLPTFC
jgi:hypothetical protein